MGWMFVSRHRRSTLVETFLTLCGDRHLNVCRYRHIYHTVGVVLVSHHCRGENTGQLKDLP
jgi:hypothetical protein